MAKRDTAPTGSAAEAELEAALPLGPQQLPELIEFRQIEDAATMKALADPLRQNVGSLFRPGYTPWRPPDRRF